VSTKISNKNNNVSHVSHQTQKGKKIRSR